MRKIDISDAKEFEAGLITFYDCRNENKPFEADAVQKALIKYLSNHFSSLKEDDSPHRIEGLKYFILNFTNYATLPNLKSLQTAAVWCLECKNDLPSEPTFSEETIQLIQYFSNVKQWLSMLQTYQQDEEKNQNISSPLEPEEQLKLPKLNKAAINRNLNNPLLKSNSTPIKKPTAHRSASISLPATSRGTPLPGLPTVQRAPNWALPKIPEPLPVVNNEAKKEEFNEMAENLTCILTTAIFLEPSTTPCGHTFEKSAMEKWINEKKQSCTCPICKKPLKNYQPTVNITIKDSVELLMKVNPELQKDRYQKAPELEQKKIPVQQPAQQAAAIMSSSSLPSSSSYSFFDYYPLYSSGSSSSSSSSSYPVYHSSSSVYSDYYSRSSQSSPRTTPRLFTETFPIVPPPELNTINVRMPSWVVITQTSHPEGSPIKVLCLGRRNATDDSLKIEISKFLLSLQSELKVNDVTPPTETGFAHAHNGKNYTLSYSEAPIGVVEKQFENAHIVFIFDDQKGCSWIMPLKKYISEVYHPKALIFNGRIPAFSLCIKPIDEIEAGTTTTLYTVNSQGATPLSNLFLQKSTELVKPQTLIDRFFSAFS